MNTLENVIPGPIPYNRPRGAEAREMFARFPENLLDLIEGTAGCSPYLDLMMRREATWLRDVIGRDLDEAFSSILTDISGDKFDALSDSLRTAKRRAALLAGLAGLCN